MLRLQQQGLEVHGGGLDQAGGRMTDSSCFGWDCPSVALKFSRPSNTPSPRQTRTAGHLMSDRPKETELKRA